ncbi:MAG: site-specific DNA-methyltransferase [Chloroflexota bacterium]
MTLPVNQVLHGDCLDILPSLPTGSVDVIFADPPYNLRLRGTLTRPNHTLVDGVDDAWDQFDSLEAYDDFTRAWLTECRRVLKATGTIWVIGSYHNIFRVGSLMMDLGFWFLNDVYIWRKTNPMPNFRGMRFTNATETLIWARRSADQRKYTFNYRAMKHFNDGKQMTNVWDIPLCTGAERIRMNGRKVHSTQKPEALLYRVILASTNPGDIILDPFFGTGTTGAVAKKLKRQFIGIEREDEYVTVATERIAAITAPEGPEALFETLSRRKLPRVAFSRLIEAGLIQPGQLLFTRDSSCQAVVRADSHLECDEITGSIHQVASILQGRGNVNGWDYWFYKDEDGNLHSIDELRQQFRADNGSTE